MLAPDFRALFRVSQVRLSLFCFHSKAWCRHLLYESGHVGLSRQSALLAGPHATSVGMSLSLLVLRERVLARGLELVGLEIGMLGGWPNSAQQAALSHHELHL